MALTSTIYKCTLHISDMDRHYYHSHEIRLAQHPSETRQRAALRLVAFCLHAHEYLEFGKGISTEDEPDLWQKDYTQTINTWIDLGLPSEKRIRQAASRSQTVIIYAYQSRSAKVWWEKIHAELARFKHLQVFSLSDNEVDNIETILSHNADIQCSIQDGEVWLTSEDNQFHITPISWQASQINSADS